MHKRTQGRPGIIVVGQHTFDGVFLSPFSEKNRFPLSLRRVPCQGKRAIGEVKSAFWPTDVPTSQYSCGKKARSIVQNRPISSTDVLSGMPLRGREENESEFDPYA